ncbi:MAG: glutamine--fructose-6-phosphate transaminase (isomerizing) [Patescibacteria group bacterium]
MCGIVGYIGKRNGVEIGLDALRQLEYRGYDSAGAAFFDSKQNIKTIKAVGKIDNLAAKLQIPKAAPLAIFHTRWATHGNVTEANAHPHGDCKGIILLAHNGIIENYRELKQMLARKGHQFRSETDTEVIAHLIEEEKRSKIPTEKAFRLALQKLRGTYGIVMLDAEEPDKLFAARNFSPLLLGVGEGEYIVASDATAVIKHTNRVIYLDDGEMAVLSDAGHAIYDLRHRARQKTLQEIEWSLEAAKKGGHAHYMRKEIFEQPEAIENSLRGRILAEEGMAKLGGVHDITEKLRQAKRIMIVACGTASYAGMVGEYLFEEYAGIPTEVDLASEFRYRKPVFREGDILLALSQSGETADTLAAVREAKEKGVLTLGIVNTVGSTIARETDAGVYQHIGPEIGVASTKAFSSQIAILTLLTLLLGRQREMSLVMGRRIANELQKIPLLIKTMFASRQMRHIKQLARAYQPYHNFLYLGRKYNFPVALEGALKLKEISYAHAEGYGAGEMKHGPIAMIDKNFPSLCIAPQDSVYEKMISNIEEIKARGGPVIAIATEGDKKIAQLADDVISIPKTLEMLTPLVSVVPLQLFAYHFAVLRGYDVDKPRNLAKSVTVE